MQKQFLSITFIKLFYYSKKGFVYISSRLINNFAENPFPARVYFLTLFTLVFLSISLFLLCFLQKQFPGDVQQKRFKFYKPYRKTPLPESLSLYSCRLPACNFIKKRLLHWCFPVNFVKFLKVPISKKTQATAPISSIYFAPISTISDIWCCSTLQST